MTLFETEGITKPFKWGELAVSLTYDEKDIIRWIMLLHNGGKSFDVDPTYSTGRFWDGLPGPKYKFDLNPQIEEVIKADARDIPLPDASVRSIMFDPPFVIKDVINREMTGIIEKRFSAYRSIEDLWAFYHDALIEFKRLLEKGGILTFKCQDTVDGGKQYMSHFEVMKQAEKIGFYCKDLFVLGRANILWSPNMANQQHARKNHCYFLVLVKT